MSHLPRYRKYYPRLYRKRVPIFWWVHRWVHMRFILRELTSVFVAFYAIVLLLHVRSLAVGPEAYDAFQAWLASPLALVLHAVAFVMVLFHSITWFNLAPKAMVVRLGERRLPGWMIAGANYAAWGVFSVVLAWILLST